MPTQPSARPQASGDVTLAELPALARELAGRVRATQFQADLIVYVETGARLLAWELCRELGLKAVAVEASRPGRGIKRVFAPLASLLPRWVSQGLRRAEERLGVHQLTPRQVVLPPGAPWANRSVLLVDDAVDTGRTIIAIRAALQDSNNPPAQIRTAVLGATTPAALAVVDFYLFDYNRCLPWSSDSAEREAAQRLWAVRRPPVA
ncbi:MAG TPA: phosphoribosyltransferase [Opitutaceae bacterium]|jgi:hypoxanthine phosphoribosyltransferase|nr:phosphoribosyltransferase [Opitutaceae bacterium]